MNMDKYAPIPATTAHCHRRLGCHCCSHRCSITVAVVVAAVVAAVTVVMSESSGRSSLVAVVAALTMLTVAWRER
jgi:hypothetical protein